eukprot:2715093-Amphidinium_carterae.1
MLNIISPARLDAYREFIARLHRTYGESIWPIIYQADVRARLEHAERVRRDGQLAHSRGQAGINVFRPDTPWDY